MKIQTANTFIALRVDNNVGVVQGGLQNISATDLDAGSVTIQAAYSSVNYKDALGVTGKGKIFKKFPIIPGIDVVGTVVESHDKRFRKGEKVLVTGCGLGETHDGGYAQFVRVPGEWVVKLPKNLSMFDSMVLGTAGFTAALCIHRMEVNGQHPKQGSILVTGASGGVGSLAVHMLSCYGYKVIAVSGKIELKKYLQNLGATEVLTPGNLQLGTRPLESVRWAGAIDNVGGETLAGISRHIELWGNIACVGLAEGFTFQATVMPLILRGVSLLGISSANCPMPLRKKLWEKISKDFKKEDFQKIAVKTVPLTKLSEVFSEMLARKTHGRIVVDCQK